MDNYRFHSRFMQAVIALGCAVILVSLYRWQLSAPIAPILILALPALVVCSRYLIQIPGKLGRISLINGFVLLALLLFGGEAAVLFATLTSLSLSLHIGRDNLRSIFDSAVAALSAFFVVWAIRLTSGPILEPGIKTQPLNSLKALFVAALIQAAVSAAITIIGEAYKIQQSVWRKRTTLLLW
ncbi:MAG TPA: hypothetical protein VKB86_20185, partial [Pyrinomonadaceae bacterium]|nr:hypothetical protein [Pyrinomonadaceae bacterium]